MTKSQPTTTTEKQETKALKPVDVFEKQLTNYKIQLDALLNIHRMSIDEFMVMIINAVKKTPKLLEAERGTLIAAALTAAELGLPPNTVMGLSFILPFNKRYREGNQWVSKLEASFQVGYQGWIEIMLRNPKIESIDSGTIYENEQWYFNLGKREPFMHTPLPPSQRGRPIASYAIAWLRDSNKPKVVVLYEEEIEMFKKISQAAASEYSPWNKEGADPRRWMQRKTCIKQLAKELPKTKEIEKTFAIDNAAETGGSQTIDQEGNVVIEESDYAKAVANANRKAAKEEAVGKTMDDIAQEATADPQSQKEGQTALNLPKVPQKSKE